MAGLIVGFVIVAQFDVIGLLSRPIAPLLHGAKLVYTHPGDPFGILMKAAFAIGLVIWLVKSDVYPGRLAARGIACVRPSDADRDAMGRIIMDELVYGVFRPESVAVFQAAIQRLRDQGCEAVILGCTEIPLIIDDGNSVLPTLDSTRLLARAALRRAAGATMGA